MEQDVQTIAYRARLAKWFSGVMFLLIAFATAVRPFVASLDSLFTYVGIANAALMVMVFLMSSMHRLHRYAPAILLTASILALVPLLFISGGVNSQFAAIVPLYPIVCSLLVGTRATAIFIGLWMVLILLAGLFSAAMPDFTGEPYHEGKTLSRAFWLFISMIASAIFAFRFNHSLTALKNKLRDQALQDPLTGLGNRRGFQERFAIEWARSKRQQKPLSLLMIDIDHFKRYNDHNGHDAGDICLQSVASCLVDNCRQGQDYVCRFGGEEFAIILADTSVSTANEVANKLAQSVQQLGLAYDAESDECVTITIGIACSEDIHALTAEACSAGLLRRADKALYEGKRRGRNRAVIFTDADPAITTI